MTSEDQYIVMEAFSIAIGFAGFGFGCLLLYVFFIKKRVDEKRSYKHVEVSSDDGIELI